MCHDELMTEATVAPADPTPGPRLSTRGSSPPRWWFHSFLAVAALALLWSQSVPGDDFFWLIIGLGMWVVMGIVWLILCLVGGGRPRWWLFVAPAMAASVIALVLVDIPIKVRFELSRADFDTAVAALPRDTRTGSGAGSVGSYDITHWSKVRGGVILHDSNSSGVTNDAGFAYLPEGPTPDLENGNFESPQFTALGGGWYAWTASW
jgi:hypothetical protein